MIGQLNSVFALVSLNVISHSGGIRQVNPEFFCLNAAVGKKLCFRLRSRDEGLAMDTGLRQTQLLIMS